jgi:DNA-binding transcriptional MerR regulator
LDTPGYAGATKGHATMGELGPEAKELLGVFTNQVMLSNAEMERRLAERIDCTREELGLQISEVRHKLDKQSETLAVHGQELAVVKTRLEEGDKRLERQDVRIGALEDRDRETAVGLGKLAGATVAGGAIGAALARVFGG